MYMTDFNKLCLKGVDPVTKGLKEISYEDKSFLKIMQKDISKVEKHHRLPLPLRNNNIGLPKNRNMVEKRLMHLKRRFQKYLKFYEDYNKFMEEILSKGYAKESKPNPPDGRTWYLPHRGVYHPHKPSKLRVVFDCSAELNGRSINKELLPGPDLASKLVGVLIKFRENKVAFMADIEKCVFKYLLLSSIEVSFAFYGGRKGISQTRQLIMRCVSMYFEVLHLEPTVTML